LDYITLTFSIFPFKNNTYDLHNSVTCWRSWAALAIDAYLHLIILTHKKVKNSQMTGNDNHEPQQTLVVHQLCTAIRSIDDWRHSDSCDNRQQQPAYQLTAM